MFRDLYVVFGIFFHLYFDAPFQDAGEHCFLNLLNSGHLLLTN